MIYTYRNYLKDALREYHMRIKTTVPLSEEMMNALEVHLERYDPKEIDGPHRTILQHHPLDFTNVPHAEVYIVDVTLGLPVSPYVLQGEIKLLLNIPESLLLVRNKSDPIEVENDFIYQQDAIRTAAADEGLTVEPLLSRTAETEATDIPPLFGNEYNNKLLDYLSYVAASRQKDVVHAENPLDPPLFDFIDLKPQTDNYNANIEGAVTPHPWWEAPKKEPEKPYPPHADDRMNSPRHLYKRYFDEENKKMKEFEVERKWVES